MAADDLNGLLDALAIEKAHIVSSAAGGSIAADFALSYPKRVLSLAITSNYAGIRKGNIWKSAQSIRPKQWNQMERWYREFSCSYIAANPRGLKAWDKLADEATKRHGRRQANNVFIRAQTLSKIKVPTLLVTGDAGFQRRLRSCGWWRSASRGASRYRRRMRPSIYWEHPKLFNVSFVFHLPAGKAQALGGDPFASPASMRNTISRDGHITSQTPWFISADGHMSEPLDLRTTPKFRDRAPTRFDNAGRPGAWWVYEGYKPHDLAVGVRAFRSNGQREHAFIKSGGLRHARPGGRGPPTFKDMAATASLPRCSTPRWASVCSGCWARSCSTSALACSNDWLAECCSYAPKQLKGIALISLYDRRPGAGELERSVMMVRAVPWSGWRLLRMSPTVGYVRRVLG